MIGIGGAAGLRAAAGFTRREARISDCGLYRYRLERWWDGQFSGALHFVMLNPSTADGRIDDPTMRRVVGFARRDGFSGAVVLNLFAMRATDPAELARAADPVGPENVHHLTRLLRDSALLGAPIVCAWGAHPIARIAARRFVAEARLERARLCCLGRTKEMAPRHPLYVKAAQPLEFFDDGAQ